MREVTGGVGEPDPRLGTKTIQFDFKLNLAGGKVTKNLKGMYMYSWAKIWPLNTCKTLGRSCILLKK